ncbi:MAG TPA: helix-turn-helix transcriptional regulator [Bdellovibrionota bacterium]|nr:helix-turn-helix transcriptional regulator [Bdellovibrionota bacterium]
MRIKKSDFVETQVHIPISPGEALKMLRELQGLSQNDLAKLTEVNQSNISAFENNTRQMGRESALVFAKALHVHPAAILFPDFDINKVA